VRGDIRLHPISLAAQFRFFGLEQRETERFGRATNLLIVAQMKVVKYAQALTPAIELISAFGIAATLIFAYYAGVKLETFLSIITALYLCYEPIKKLGYLNSELNRGAASLQRLEYVLDQPLTITDPAMTRYTVTNLGSGTWYFTVVSYTVAGVESSHSDVVSKTIS